MFKIMFKSNNGKYAYLAKNTILFTVSSFGSRLLSFFLVPLYTNVLSTQEYGIADLITTTSSLLLFIVTICIADAVLRFTIELNENQDNILRYGVRVSAIGIVFFAIVLLCTYKLNLISWPKYCYIFLFLQLFLSAWHNLCANYLRAIDKIKQVSLAGIISTLVTILCNIFFLLFVKLELIGYMISMIIGAFVALIYEIYQCGNILIFIKGDICDKTVRISMIRYSIPLVLNGIGWWMNNSIDKYFITLLCGASLNGIYSVSYKIPMVLTTCQQIFSNAWSLSAIKEFDASDNNGFFSNTYNIYNAFLIILCSGMILINVFLARILFAKDFFEAWKFAPFLLISMVFSALSSFVGGIVAAIKKSKVLAVSTVISAIVNIVLNAILIPNFGAFGAAVATAVSFALIWKIRVNVAHKYVQWDMNIRKDYIAYMLLIVQAFIEQVNGHMYLIQILIFTFLLILYKDQVIFVVNKVCRK